MTLQSLRASAPSPDDLEFVPASAEANLIGRATENMDRAINRMGGMGDADFAMKVAGVQAAVAQAQATARLADATEALARATRRTT